LVTFLICVWAVWRKRVLSQPEDRSLRIAVLATFCCVAFMMLVMVKVGEFSLFWFVWHLVPGASALRAGGRSTTNHNSDSSARQQGGELGGNA